MKIAVVGAGSMGEAFASLLISKSIVEPEEILLVTRTDTRHARLKAQYPGVRVSVNPEESFYPDLVLLAVKPQDFQSAANSLAHWYDINPLVISLMAGISVKRIADSSPLKERTKVIRVMPNLPFMFGEGATGFYCAPIIKEEDQALFKVLFEPTGFLSQVKEEALLDVVTALSGSGPGYFAYLYRALAKHAFDAGLEEDQAELLLRQTLHGFVSLLNEGLTAKEIERLVTSKGGTTDAAKTILKKRKADDVLGEMLSAAVNRARELSLS